jgi:hypothetical protein
VLKVLFDGGGMVVGSGGGGGGHTPDPVSDEFGLASLVSILGDRVPVGQPRGPIQIRVICLYAGLGGVESGTGMTSTGSSSLMATVTTTTSSSSATPSSPSLIPGEDNISCLCVTGYGHGPILWMVQGVSQRPHGEVAGSEGSIG